jgi:uncharacterized short protein YbdD (DUF466 family)
MAKGERDQAKKDRPDIKSMTQKEFYDWATRNQAGAKKGGK